MTPRVTVLIAVYNGGEYLHEAVASVLEQTYDHFELLLVDDSSTDGAVEELPRDRRIRVLRNGRNLGQIPSLNRGLREAAGVYVARLDHDDVCLPGRLERQVELLDSEPHVALAATWVDIVDNSGRLWAKIRTEIDSYVNFATAVTTARLVLAHPSLMFRRDVVLGLGGFDERLGAAEDQELYRRLVLARHDARVVPELLVLYRRHDAQMTYAKTAMVRANDAISHERFLAELASGTPTRALHRLFSRDPAFWVEPPLEGNVLEDFLDAAARRLRLDSDERRSFAAGLARAATGSMLAGWAACSGSYGPRSRAIAAFASRHGSSGSRLLAAARPALTATAPFGRSVAGARARLRRTLRSDALLASRRIARRSRALRWLYARVVDTRSVDD